MKSLEVSGSVIGLIGDPHLGKKFVTGVPFSRRGEREALQFEQFRAEVCSTEYPTIIVMGDLFDKFIVDYETLYKTYLILCKADETGTNIYIIQGNHDVSRNAEQKSSLDVLHAMVSHLSNVKIIREVEYIYTSDGDTKLMLCPYYEFLSAREVIESEITGWITAPQAVFGHWEIESFGGSDSNLCPFDLLAPKVNYIVTGHIHSAKTMWLNSEGIENSDDKVQDFDYLHWCKVIVTGSMQPYSFAEDEDADIYVTLSLEEYNDYIEINGKESFHNSCVRILLKDGEEAPTDVDALQFIYKKVNENNQEVVEAKMEVFSFKDLFIESMKDNSVSDVDAEIMWNKYQEVCSDAANT